MGRLNFTAGDYIVEGQKVMRFVDSKDPNKRIDYVPYGLGLPSQFDDLIPLRADDTSAASLAGVPMDWIQGVSQQDKQTVRSNEVYLSNENIAAVKSKTAHSELGHLQICMQSVEGNVLDEWLMRTLEFLTLMRAASTPIQKMY